MLRFPTTETEEQLAGMLRALVSRGIDVAQFREVAGDLEDAFLSVANPDALAAENARRAQPSTGGEMGAATA